MKLRFRVVRYEPSCFEREGYIEEVRIIKEKNLYYYISDLVDLENINIEVEKYIEFSGSDECDSYYFYDENDDAIPFDDLLSMNLIEETEPGEGYYRCLI